MKKYYCKECGKEISTKNTIRCSSCHIRHLWKIEYYKNRPKGKEHHNWKSGLSKCIDCNKELSNYVGKRCKKCQSLIMKKIRIGKNNPAYKDGFYCRNKKCIDCGKHCASGAIRCKSCNEHLNKLGKKNPQYIHGRGHLPYTKDFPKIRLAILKRDNNKCVICHKFGKDVHHIDYNPKNNKKNNLITVCRKCHTKTNANRDYWYAYFIYIRRTK